MNSETIESIINRATNMDAEKARYLLFEKTNSNACLCNPLHEY